MDFDLTDDQRLLTDSVTRLLAAQYGFEQRKALLKSPEGWSPALWSQYAELGLLGLPIAEEFGGFGGGGGFGGTGAGNRRVSAQVRFNF